MWMGVGLRGWQGAAERPQPLSPGYGSLKTPPSSPPTRPPGGGCQGAAGGRGGAVLALPVAAPAATSPGARFPSGGGGAARARGGRAGAGSERAAGAGSRAVSAGPRGREETRQQEGATAGGSRRAAAGALGECSFLPPARVPRSRLRRRGPLCSHRPARPRSLAGDNGGEGALAAARGSGASQVLREVGRARAGTLRPGRGRARAVRGGRAPSGAAGPPPPGPPRLPTSGRTAGWPWARTGEPGSCGRAGGRPRTLGPAAGVCVAGGGGWLLRDRWKVSSDGDAARRARAHPSSTASGLGSCFVSPPSLILLCK